jgi:hypothetical protein
LRTFFKSQKKIPPRDFSNYYQLVQNRVQNNNTLLPMSIFNRTHYGLTKNFQKRFTHTTSEPLLRSTSVIIGQSTNWAERGALLNNSWNYYNIITKNHNLIFPLPRELYNIPIFEYKRNSNFYMP